MNESQNIADLVREDVSAEYDQCEHFPERCYWWPESLVRDREYLGAHCAKCASDYLMERIEGVTINGLEVYR